MTRQKIDPATKAQAALDVADRRLEAAFKKAKVAEIAMKEAQAEIPPLVAARAYAAANPALPAPSQPACVASKPTQTSMAALKPKDTSA